MLFKNSSYPYKANDNLHGPLGGLQGLGLFSLFMEVGTSTIDEIPC